MSEFFPLYRPASLSSAQPQRPGTISEAQFERSTRVALRDAQTLRTRILARLAELRAQEQQARALIQDASGVRAGEMLLGLLDAQQSNT
ncbi:hypothetical protein [Burkholderia diffusa]|uniref:hypothetical protein n=1 Tax=Burkholderia diffusa TaxID=488732 RepID=UPI00075F0665|nr:hypothetical protein [Burkholderia diffusa]KVH51200.1 hypothetical protein WJ39_08595 [Burkholderia diffusa]